MSRSNYSDDCENYNLWQGAVNSAIRGKRGQNFLRDLAAAMDEMPNKRLVASELIDQSGDVCAIGSVCKKRGLNVDDVDIYDPHVVGGLVDIARAMAAEIEYQNDEYGPRDETPEQRWTRMRKWVSDKIIDSSEDYA